jgi:hypothetical protein
LHRWARLLRQQKSVTIYRLTSKVNKLPLSVCRNKGKVAISIFLLQQTNESCCFRLVLFSVYITMSIDVQVRLVHLQTNNFHLHDE